MEIVIKLPKPHEAQKHILRTAKKYNVLCCGRRFGKTSLAIDLCKIALEGYPVGYFSPIYKDILEVWREVLSIYAPAVKRANSQEKRVELITGGVIEFWSLENRDAGRGRKYKRVLIDEAAKVPGLLDIWNGAISPTLLDYKGDAYFMSTPKGLNDFHTLWQKGSDPAGEWAHWQYTTYDNPFIDNKMIDDLKATNSERFFAQEIMAQFVAHGSGVFRNVNACATGQQIEKAIPGRSYLISIDTARVNDFNAVIVFDIEAKEVVYIDRFNMVDTSIQLSRIVGVWERFNRPSIVLEQNGAYAILDALTARGIHVIGFQTTNASKTAAIQSLESALDHMEIKFPNNEVLINELLSFESEKLPSGLIRYSAPPGAHDDTVMALAIGYHHINAAAPVWII